MYKDGKMKLKKKKKWNWKLITIIKKLKDYVLIEPKNAQKKNNANNIFVSI